MELFEYDISFQNRVAHADPLNFDPFAKEIPALNEKEDLQSLIQILTQITPDKNFISGLKHEEKLAAMRDLGMVISSIRKLKTQPLTAVPHLEQILFQIADDTSMPPRDTAYHYGPWNPEGERQRTFTSLKDEWGLINGVRLAIPACENATASVIKLREKDIFSEDFTALAKEVQKHLKKAVEGIVYAIKVIDPYVFSHQLRPFFDPIEIRGKSYIGPGGGQMPLYLFDRLLWFDGADEAYSSFIDECNMYMPKYIQKLYKQNQHEGTLLNNIQEQISKQQIAEPRLYQNLDELDEIFKVLFKFRKPHENLAKRSLNKQNRGNYNTGSAGYQYGLVKHIYDLNREAYLVFRNKQIPCI